MCGEALKSKLAFRGDAAHEIYTKIFAGNAAFYDPENGGASRTIRQAAGAGFYPTPDADLRNGHIPAADHERKQLGKVLIGRFQNSEKTPSASAFVQQRQKLLPAALETLFHRFTALLRPEKTFCGCRLLAVDGSSLKSAACPEDPASYRPGTPRQHGWNLWHMNALFEENGIYTDLIVQKEHEKNECRALCQMADRSRISGKVILLADRNYESCNNLAHLEKRNWNYLIRIRDKARGIAYGMPLPDQPEFDIPLKLTLGRLTPRQLVAQGLAVPKSYYRIPPTMTFDFLESNSPDFYEISFRTFADDAAIRKPLSPISTRTGSPRALKTSTPDAGYEPPSAA